MEIGSKADLVKFLTDLEGQLATMQETVDKLSPVEEEAAKEEVAEEVVEEEVSDKEVDEVDALLQED